MPNIITDDSQTWPRYTGDRYELTNPRDGSKQVVDGWTIHHLYHHYIGFSWRVLPDLKQDKEKGK